MSRTLSLAVIPGDGIGKEVVAEGLKVLGQALPHEVATEVSLNTAFGIERVVRDAYARAQARPLKKLTLVHKNNVLVHAGHLWKNIFDRVGEEFPEVTTDYLHVDAATIFFVTQP